MNTIYYNYFILTNENNFILLIPIPYIDSIDNSIKRLLCIALCYFAKLKIEIIMHDNNNNWYYNNIILEN